MARMERALTEHLMALDGPASYIVSSLLSPHIPISMLHRRSLVSGVGRHLRRSVLVCDLHRLYFVV